MYAGVERSAVCGTNGLKTGLGRVPPLSNRHDEQIKKGHTLVQRVQLCTWTVVAIRGHAKTIAVSSFVVVIQPAPIKSVTACD
jgi:hypothetical protein